MRHFFKVIVASALATVATSTLAIDVSEYSPVTDVRLRDPEPANWLQYRGNYAGWGYSPLAQINDKNVASMQLAWSFPTGQTEGHQAPPIVNNGYMFVTTPGAQVIALEAKTGKELWRYKKEMPKEMMQLHPTNRGVALYGDKVYVATVDCNLVALDAKTGTVAWSQKVCEWEAINYMTLAPLAVKGKIMVGASGGEAGVRGFVAAFDAQNGNEVWRTYTTPKPEESGGDTWPGETYKTGGGSIWITGTYDPESNLTFWGTGNPAPWPTENRKGDNLYTSSTIGLDVDTGALKTYHQYTPNDAWDWDEVSAPLLIDTEIKGKKVKAAVHAGRNGYLWVLERKLGKMGFVDAWPFVHNNVIKSLDPKTGRPTYDEAHRPGLSKAVSFCPSLWGGKDWPPEAWNPKTGLFYIPANNNLCAELPVGEASKYKKGDLYIGYPIEGVMGSLRGREKTAPKTIGEIQAWDLKTGKQVWATKFDSINWGPLLTTGGNLIFAGGTNDRMFRALNATTGDVLWKSAMPSGVTAVPTSFEVDGVQYVSVMAGWGVDAERMQNGVNAITGDKVTVPQGGTVMVFKVNQPVVAAQNLNN